MKHLIACLASILLAGVAAPAGAQTKKSTEEAQELRERAIQRCKENRGSDCASEAGLAPWIREEREMTPEQRQAAIAARQKRERCAKNPKGPGC